MSVRIVIRSFAVAGSLIATTAFFPPVSSLAFPPSSLRHPPSSVAGALDTAIARMGGEDALRKIERVRFEMMTLWQRMGFEPRSGPGTWAGRIREAGRDMKMLPACRRERKRLA